MPFQQNRVIIDAKEASIQYIFSVSFVLGAGRPRWLHEVQSLMECICIDRWRIRTEIDTQGSGAIAEGLVHSACCNRKDLTETLAFVLYSETGYKIFYQRRIEKTSPILETIKTNQGVWNSCGWFAGYTTWLSCPSEIRGEGTWNTPLIFKQLILEREGKWENHQCKRETSMGCLFYAPDGK